MRERVSFVKRYHSLSGVYVGKFPNDAGAKATEIVALLCAKVHVSYAEKAGCHSILHTHLIVKGIALLLVRGIQSSTLHDDYHPHSVYRLRELRAFPHPMAVQCQTGTVRLLTCG